MTELMKRGASRAFGGMVWASLDRFRSDKRSQYIEVDCSHAGTFRFSVGTGADWLSDRSDNGEENYAEATSWGLR